VRISRTAAPTAGEPISAHIRAVFDIEHATGTGQAYPQLFVVSINSHDWGGASQQNVCACLHSTWLS
jgi:hypothetical protein